LAEFVAFLNDIVVNQPRGKETHVIADNLSAHKTKRVDEFLAQYPNVHLHFTPTYSSWLNQVELWFAKIERDVIARGVFHFRTRSEEETHALHPPVQQAGQTREMEVLRSIASNYSRFNRYRPLVVKCHDVVCGRRRATKVVARTTMPRSPTPPAPHFAQTLWGLGDGAFRAPGSAVAPARESSGGSLGPPTRERPLTPRRSRNSDGLMPHIRSNCAAARHIDPSHS
jgi:hypothetical protein